MHQISRRILLAGAAGAVAGPALSQSAPRLPTLREGRGQFVEFEPAERVPDFRLKRLDGKEMLLSAYHGNVLIVNFWASWCPPCRREIPMLDALARTQDPPGVRVIAISLDQGGAKSVKPYLAELKVRDLPVFLDPDFRVARRADEATPQDPFRLFGLPLSYVLSPGGRNLGYFTGLVDWQSPQARLLLESAARRD